MSGPDCLSLPSFSYMGLTLTANKSSGKSVIEKFLKINLNLPNNNRNDLPSHIKKIIPKASRQFID